MWQIFCLCISNMQVFGNGNRLIDDTCVRDAKEFQNDYINNYLTFNYYPTNYDECPKDDAENKMNDMVEFSLDNYMHIADGYGTPSHCLIDKDSEIRHNTIWTHDHKSKQQLCSRVFQDIPDLSKGGFVPQLESKLVQGEDTAMRKSCDVLAEKSLFDHHIIPMVDCLKNTIQNPEHIIMDNWGGVGTRDGIRQEEYLNDQGYFYDGKVWQKKSC